MTFQNLDQIKSEFNLAEDDPKEIKKRLLRSLADLHPDKHGGEDFASAKDKEKFLKINEAIEFLESLVPEQTKALVPANEMTELVKLVRDLILVDKKADKVANFESQLSERIEANISQLGKQYLAPRITVSVITAVLTFVWLLPGTISEHPVLKNYLNIDDPRFLATWAFSLVLTILVLYGTSLSVDNQERFQSRLKTETFQNRAFESFLDNEGNVSFSKSNFVRYLGHWPYYLNRKTSSNLSFVNLLLQLIGRAPLVIDPESAQIIADVVFERAERRGVIRKIDTTKRLEDVYSLSEEKIN